MSLTGIFLIRLIAGFDAGVPDFEELRKMHGEVVEKITLITIENPPGLPDRKAP
jgi:hypothetical protein